MVSRMRSNHSHTANRRSHHALVEPRLTKCECGAWHLRHRACQACGKYRGHTVVDIVARTEKLQKRTKRKEEELMASGQITADKSTQQEDKAATKKEKVEEKAEADKAETVDKRVRAKSAKGK